MRTNGIDGLWRAEEVAPRNESSGGRLARYIAAHAPHDGTFELRIPGVYVSRYSRSDQQCVHALRLPCLSIIAQGAKTVFVGQEALKYDESRMMIYSVALPIAAQVTRASRSMPYLALRMDLEPRKIAELVLRVYPNGVPAVPDRKGAYVFLANAGITHAAGRLMECLAQAGDTEFVAPLIVEEILLRVLYGQVGPRVAQMGFLESGLARVGKALTWLRQNFSQPMKVEELAKLAHMSVSSFHEHFRAITSMSPLQYQKVLRLQEARRLMLSMMLDAGDACQRVGYLSASQFSREYSRFFGNPPSRDISRLRNDAATVA